MSITPPVITPIALTGVPANFRTHPDIQPFSERSGTTYTELLEAMKRWLQHTLVPYLNTNFEDVQTSWSDEVDALTEQINSALTSQANTVNGALTDQSNEITAALTDQQTAVNAQLASAVAALQGGSVSVVDPGVAAMVNDTTSQTRAALDALYAAKSVVQALTDLTATGRLSQASLDAAYTTTDAEVAAFASNPASQTRAAFNAAYQRVQFQVANGYIQWKYLGDATWTNLESLSDITGATGPTGPAGAPGGNQELAYAETTTTTSVPAGTGSTDVPSLSISITMPSRPVRLKFGAIANFVATSGSDGAIRIIETTGGGSTIIAEAHTGYSTNSGDYQQIYSERRITGTAGTVRTFKLQARQISGVTWSINAASTFPTWIAADQC